MRRTREERSFGVGSWGDEVGPRTQVRCVCGRHLADIPLELVQNDPAGRLPVFPRKPYGYEFDNGRHTFTCHPKECRRPPRVRTDDELFELLLTAAENEAAVILS